MRMHAHGRRFAARIQWERENIIEWGELEALRLAWARHRERVLRDYAEDIAAIAESHGRPELVSP